MKLIRFFQNNLLEFCLFITVFIKLLSFYFFINVDPFNNNYSPTYFTIITAIALLFVSISFLFRKRWVYVLVLNTSFSLFLLIHVLYFRYFEGPLTINTIYQIGNLKGLGPSIFTILSKSDLLLFSDFILFPLIIIKRSAKKRNFKTALILTVIAVVVGSPKFIKDIYKKEKIWFDFDNKLKLVEFTPVGYQLIDMVTFCKQNIHRNLNGAEKKIIEDYFIKGNGNEIDSTYNYLKGIAKGRNVIIIQVESMANFVIQHNAEDIPLTPHLNKLIESSLYFKNFHSQAYHGNTSDAEFVTLTSLLPVERGSVFMQYPHNTYYSLPKLLREMGYSTVAFHGNDKCFWNRGEMYKSLGIEKFYDISDIVTNVPDGFWLMDDSLVYDKAISELKKIKKPFFSLIVTLENHLGAYNGNSGYLKGIRDVDRKLGYFINQLSLNGLTENSLIVIYGDHMPDINFDQIKKDKDFKDCNFDGRNIPLIISIPGLGGNVVNKIAGQVDILPTVLFLLGFEQDQYRNKLLGRNILTSKLDYVNYYPNMFLNTNSTSATESEILENLKKQFMVSDLIIRGNYFAKDNK